MRGLSSVAVLAGLVATVACEATGDDAATDQPASLESIPVCQASTTTGTVQWRFAQVAETDEVEVFEPLPLGFDLQVSAPFGQGRSLLLGFIDETPDTDLTGDRSELAVVELTDRMTIRRGIEPVGWWEEPGFFGPYAFHASRDDGRIDIFDAVDLTAISRIDYPEGSEHAALSDAIAVYDGKAKAVALFAWSASAPTPEQIVTTVSAPAIVGTDPPASAAITVPSSDAISMKPTPTRTVSTSSISTLPAGHALVDLNTLTVGQCLLGAELVEGDIGSGLMEVVDCSVPHHAEVFHVSQLEDPAGTPYPAMITPGTPP